MMIATDLPLCATACHGVATDSLMTPTDLPLRATATSSTSLDFFGSGFLLHSYPSLLAACVKKENTGRYRQFLQNKSQTFRLHSVENVIAIKLN